MRACLRSGTEYCIEACASVALGSDQRHEPAALKSFHSDFSILFAHQLKFLRLGWSNWDDHAPAFGELIEQASRDLRRGGRNYNRVKRSELRQAVAAVSYDDPDVRNSQLAKCCFGAVSENGVALDREHFTRQGRQERCLITRAGPNFQNTLAAVESQGFERQGDDERLRNGLFLGNWNGMIRVCLVLIIGRHKLVSRDLKHRIEHALITNAAASQLRFNHSRLFFNEGQCYRFRRRTFTSKLTIPF